MKTVVISACGQVKQNNEDCYLINNKSYFDANIENHEEIFLAAVFDGVGGSNYGEVAAQISSHILASHFEFLANGNIDDLLKVVMTINEQLLFTAHEKPIYKGYATTIAGIKIQNDSLISFNVGDSRVYRCRLGLLKQLSYDDTYFNFMKSIGRVTDENAAKYKNSHIITSYLGKNDFEIDDIRAILYDFGVMKEDIFLICTDGVSDMCSDDILETILSSKEDLKNKSLQIQSIIESNGSKDNYTYILIEV